MNIIKADRYFKENLKNILENGSVDENPRPHYKDGTPAHTKFITNVFEKYDLSKGEFPITTLRNTAIKTGIREILWIYQAQSNNLEKAKELKVNWWHPWDIGDNTIGKRYGYTVYKYDLLNRLLEGLKENPFSRRHIINLYQYTDLDSSEGLYPCAYETVWSVREYEGELYLDTHLNQRSSDYVTANYINKAQYVSLQLMVCGHLGYKPGTFSHMVNNLHIYDRHINAAKEILDRPVSQLQPIIKLKNNKNFYDYNVNDFIIYNNTGRKLESPLEIAV